MIGRKAELRLQIDDIIDRLKVVQKTIAGSRQPASRFELEELKELGKRYTALNRELQNFVDEKNRK